MPSITATSSATVPQASDFGLTSLCKPSPTTGQFRITADVLGGTYSLAKYGGGATPISGDIAAAQTLVTVPWSSSSDIWILTVTQGTFKQDYTKAIGNNPLCSPSVGPTELATNPSALAPGLLPQVPETETYAAYNKVVTFVTKGR